MQVNSRKELIVYQKAFGLAMRVFEVSKSFPVEQRYSLTHQVRRSSRSVCTNLREVWAKRRYPAYFVSMLTDADGENSETDTWLDFALASGYLEIQIHRELADLSQEVGAMLGTIIRHPEKFVIPSRIPPIR